MTSFPNSQFGDFGGSGNIWGNNQNQGQNPWADQWGGVSSPGLNNQMWGGQGGQSQNLQDIQNMMQPPAYDPAQAAAAQGLAWNPAQNAYSTTGGGLYGIGELYGPEFFQAPNQLGAQMRNALWHDFSGMVNAEAQNQAMGQQWAGSIRDTAQEGKDAILQAGREGSDHLKSEAQRLRDRGQEHIAETQKEFDTLKQEDADRWDAGWASVQRGIQAKRESNMVANLDAKIKAGNVQAMQAKEDLIATSADNATSAAVQAFKSYSEGQKQIGMAGAQATLGARQLSGTFDQVGAGLDQAAASMLTANTEKAHMMALQGDQMAANHMLNFPFRHTSLFEMLSQWAATAATPGMEDIPEFNFGATRFA